MGRQWVSTGKGHKRTFWGAGNILHLGGGHVSEVGKSSLSYSLKIGAVLKMWVFFFLLFFLGVYPRHMEVPRSGVELELQLPAYARATATPDPSHVCDLHHSSWQCWILNPLSETRNRTCVLMDTSQLSFCCATTGTPLGLFSSDGMHKEK